jgi:HSP20 family protein
VSVPETAGWLPLVESYKKGTDLIYKCELPGVDPKEVDVTIDESGRELVIRGERKTEKDTKEEDYIQREISYGVFERRFMLPEGVKTDEVKAKFTNGILEISVPAPAVTSKAKKIQVEAPEMIEGEKTETRKAA